MAATLNAITALLKHSQKRILCHERSLYDVIQKGKQNVALYKVKNTSLAVSNRTSESD
jgi:hypothetical protein